MQLRSCLRAHLPEARGMLQRALRTCGCGCSARLGWALASPAPHARTAGRPSDEPEAERRARRAHVAILQCR
eukprot:135202-Prymnesium_polylepis.2